MTDSDVIVRVARHRPELDDEWTAETRGLALSAVFDAPPEQVDRVRWFSRRRVVVGTGVAMAAAAAAVVAATVLPSGTPGGPSSAEAATLKRLAVVAGTRGQLVKDGQYAYRNVTDAGSGPIGTRHLQIWRGTNGETWSRESTKTCLTNSPALNASFTEDYYNHSAAQFAALPTTADGLAAFISAHPEGDNRGDENLWAAVDELLLGGGNLVPPAVRAAAIKVLARVDGVSVRNDAHDSLGRPAIAITRDRHTLYLDADTSRVLEQRESDDSQGSSRTLINTEAIVSHLPAIPHC